VFFIRFHSKSKFSNKLHWISQTQNLTKIRQLKISNEHSKQLQQSLVAFRNVPMTYVEQSNEINQYFKTMFEGSSLFSEVCATNTVFWNGLRRNIPEMCQCFQTKFFCSLQEGRLGHAEPNRGLHCVRYFFPPVFAYSSQHPVLILFNLRTIPPWAWKSVCCECCLLSGRGRCDELITRPEESYRIWCVVGCDLETSWMRRSWPTGDCGTKKN
jgi:hypothetical protein